MTHPIGQNQNVSLNQNLVVTERQTPLIQNQFKDTLYLKPPSGLNFSFNSIWNAITNFFKSIFGCCNGRITQIPNLETKIAQIAADKQFVWFYKKEENALTEFLGNFYPCNINLGGMKFKCAEAAYQAAKFAPNRFFMKRFENLNGEAAYRLSRELNHHLSPADWAQWNARKLDVMGEVVKAKFAQNPALLRLLLATGNAYLVEHTPVKGRDAFWSDDHDGTGQNWLGRILMQERGGFGGTSVVPRNPQYDQFLRR